MIISPFPYWQMLSTVFFIFPLSSQVFTQSFLFLGARFLVGGDFNAKHPARGSCLINPRWIYLHKFVHDNFHFISSLNFMFWSTGLNKQPILIDFYVTKGLHILDITDKLTSGLSCLQLALVSFIVRSHVIPLTGITFN